MHAFAPFVLLGLAAALNAAPVPAAEPSPPIAPTRTLAAWEFDRPGDLQGWQPNAHLAGVAVTNGALVCRSVGSDPILELGTPLDVPATPWQRLEIRLRADRDGTAEVFWSNTSTGRYGGFSQEKTTRFSVLGDGQAHTYRLLPFWHPEGRIVRLRFDVYDGTAFAIDSIRLEELARPPATERARFDFTRSEQGWTALPGADARAGADGLEVKLTTREGWILAPPVRLSAEDLTFVSVRFAVDRGARGTVYFATEHRTGLHAVSFPLEPGAGEQTYNIDLLTAPEWRGRVVALGLQPSDAPDATARVRWCRVSDTPQGPAQLRVESFALATALPRAERPFALAARVTNTGGEAATNLVARLELPAGLRVLDQDPTRSIPALGPGEDAPITWLLQASQPLTNTAHLVLAALPAETVRSAARVAVLPALRLPTAHGVPEPKPVRGPHEVGAYYFPGWQSASQWEPITRYPERKPVLGWYREGDPEVADWHIKWAVEHGITFFAYDWYWTQGARQLEHALHDGFFQARYRHLLKFCLLWANHNPPRTSSLADGLAVTRYWIEHYFRRPEHLTVQGLPVVIIFSPHRFTEDLGSTQVKRVFDAMRAECRAAGLPGLFLVACVADAAGARHAAAEGYDAVTAYNWPGLGMTGSGMHAPFATLLDGYRRHWEDLREQQALPLLPLPVCGGWDSRPWHGENQLIRFGRTPELFQQHLVDALQFLTAPASRRNSGTSIRADAPPLRPDTNLPTMVLVEAWNEWGEGSYIEPHQEYGFGYLDAIRAVFTRAPEPHEDVTPADVGRGPYDVPPPPPGRTEWDFATGEEGWTAMMQLADARAHDGVLTARTAGNDPAFTSPPLQARAGAYTRVRIRLRLRPLLGSAFRDRAQLFWRSSRLPESEVSSVAFDVSADGEWHEYTLDVGGHRRWLGVITRLRLDPCNRANVQVDVDRVVMSQ